MSYSLKLKSEYKEFCDLVEVVSEQMLQCQANLLTTYILHDEGSQNWSSNQSYYEGQRGWSAYSICSFVSFLVFHIINTYKLDLFHQVHQQFKCFRTLSKVKLNF